MYMHIKKSTQKSYEEKNYIELQRKGSSVDENFNLISIQQCAREVMYVVR